MAILKGWTFGSSDGRPRGKQGKESRKLGGREDGEPPRSRRRRWEAAGGRAETLGEKPKKAGKETGIYRRGGRGKRRGEWAEGRRVPILGAKTEGEDDGEVGSGCREARAGKQRTEQE
jgi:hypothetical protein